MLKASFPPAGSPRPGRTGSDGRPGPLWLTGRTRESGRSPPPLVVGVLSLETGTRVEALPSLLLPLLGVGHPLPVRPLPCLRLQPPMCADATGTCAVTGKHGGLTQALPRSPAPPPSHACPCGRAVRPLGPGVQGYGGLDGVLTRARWPGAWAAGLRPPEPVSPTKPAWDLTFRVATLGICDLECV